MNKWLKIPHKAGDSDFIRIFKRKEFQQLSGVNGRKILQLSGIIFLTLLTLSYALGSLNYLRARMDNPYTNWVDMPLSSSTENSYDSLPALMQYFESEKNRNPFFLDNVTGYVVADARLVHAADFKKTFPCKGRTVEPQEKLLNAILVSENRLSGFQEVDSIFGSEHECGVIVTRKTLESLGYEDWRSAEKIAMKFYDNYIYVDVLGVVKDLPDYCDYICTPRFYNLLLNGSIPPYDSGVMNTDTTNLMTIVSPIADVAKVKTLADAQFTAKGIAVVDIKQEKIPLSAAFTHYRYELVFNHSNIPGVEARKAFFEASQNTVVPSGDWYCVSKKQFAILTKPYYLAFNFTDLGKVWEFKSFMSDRFRMSINLAQVEAKDNFKKVTQITFIVCTTLFIFGILSIVLFITNLLQTHLEGIRSNLGTLKAFGLKDGWLQDVYNIIIFYFLFFAFTIALAPLIVLVSLSKLLLTHSPFEILNIFILLSIVLIFGISLYFARRTTGYLVQATPGDLIYGR